MIRLPHTLLAGLAALFLVLPAGAAESPPADTGLPAPPGGLVDWLARTFPNATTGHDAFGLTIYGIDQIGVPLDSATLRLEMVILVHGLDDPGGLWNPLIRQLLGKDYLIGELRYPNDQAIGPSARYLYNTLLDLRRRGVTRVHLVSHSMGGLVCRELLTHPDLYGGDGRGTETLPAVDRLITIGTPHHGSTMARFRLLSEASEHLARFMRGESAILDAFFDGDGAAQRDLLPGSDFLKTLNQRPHPAHTQFTIIAGCIVPERQGASDGQRDMREAVGDGCVSIPSSRLDGVTDYHLVEADHIALIVPLKARQKELPPALPIILEKLAEQ